MISQIPASEGKPETAPATGVGEFWTPGRFLMMLAGLLALLFAKLLLGTDSLFYRDFGVMWYPVTEYNRACLLSGQLPLWNPYLHCGVPYMAQMGQWYPPFLLGTLLPLPWSVNVLMVLHLFWSGWGMHWLVRRWGGSPFAAGFAATAYVFNGVTLSCLQWQSNTASLSWIPWTVGSAAAAWQLGGRWTVLAAGASAMQVLTGTPEITVLTWLILGALWISEWMGGQIPFGASARRLAGTVLLAAGLTMVQILPFIDLLRCSQRDQSSGTEWSMPGWGWANLLAPLFHCFCTPQGTWFQQGQALLGSYYLGAGVLMLAVVAAGVGASRNRVFWAVALFYWVMALGPEGVFYGWVRRVFPFIGAARFPVKFAILPAFLIPLLAARSLDYLRTQPWRAAARRLGLLCAMALLLMGFCGWFAWRYPFPFDNWVVATHNLIWRGVMLVAFLGTVMLSIGGGAGRRRLAGQVLVLAVVVAEAWTHSPNLVPTLPGSNLAPGFWTLDGKPPPPRLEQGRVLIGSEADQRLLQSRVTDMTADFTGRRLAEDVNLNLLDRVPKASGGMPLRLAREDRLQRYIYYTPMARCGQGLLDCLAVTWVSSPRNPTDWQARTNGLPVFSAGQAPEFLGEEAGYQAITSSNFDARARVVLPEEARGFIRATNQSRCQVNEVRFGESKVEARVEAAQPSLVVFSQSYHHWWRASVDGRPARLWRANYAFQALEVPAGAHRLVWVYRDPNLVVGAMLSSVSLGACFWVWRRSGRKVG